jgi:hypothetical protein
MCIAEVGNLQEFHSLYPSRNIKEVNEIKRRTWVGHVSCMEVDEK